MITKKIIQVGNALGITLPVAELRRLGLHQGDIVGVTLQKVSERDKNGCKPKEVGETE